MTNEAPQFLASQRHESTTAHALGRAALAWMHHAVIARSRGLDHAADIATSRATAFVQSYTLWCLDTVSTPAMESTTHRALDVAAGSDTPYVTLALMFPGLPIPTHPEEVSA